MYQNILPYCDKLYNELMTAIESCRLHSVDSLSAIECCFQNAEKARMNLDKFVAAYSFVCKEEEIRFFKNIKPQFSALVDFFILLYKGNTFCPDEQEKADRYWRHEMEQVNCFFQLHHQFYSYYREGRTDKDDCYFMRCHILEITWQASFYTPCPGACSTHDCLLAACMAREKYLDYITNQLSCNS